MLVYMSASARSCRLGGHLASIACFLTRCDDGTVGGSTLALLVVPRHSGCFDDMRCSDEVECIGFVGLIWRCPIGGPLEPALYVHVCQ